MEYPDENSEQEKVKLMEFTQQKKYYKVFADIDDLLMCFGGFLRYALGRRTYITGVVPEFIKDNIDLINKKWFVNYIRDICNYEEDRRRWNTCSKDDDVAYDDICDYSGWLGLKDLLVEEYAKRRYEYSLDYYGIKLTELHLYHVVKKDEKTRHKANAKTATHIGICSSPEKVPSMIYDYCELRGNLLQSYRSSEKKGVIQYDVGLENEYFELSNQSPDSTPEWRLAPDFGRRLPYRGEMYILGGDINKKPFFDNAFCVPIKYTSEQIKSACIRIYRELAQRDISEKVQEYSNIMGVEASGVNITSAVSRWGSCSDKNVLSFSWRLITASDDVVEYVVVHELAHTIERKHTEKFWSIVESILPDYRNRKEKLKLSKEQKELNEWLLAG